MILLVGRTVRESSSIVELKDKLVKTPLLTQLIEQHLRVSNMPFYSARIWDHIPMALHPLLWKAKAIKLTPLDNPEINYALNLLFIEDNWFPVVTRCDTELLMSDFEAHGLSIRAFLNSLLPFKEILESITERDKLDVTDIADKTLEIMRGLDEGQRRIFTRAACFGVSQLFSRVLQNTENEKREAMVKWSVHLLLSGVDEPTSFKDAARAASAFFRIDREVEEAIQIGVCSRLHQRKAAFALCKQRAASAECLS